MMRLIFFGGKGGFWGKEGFQCEENYELITRICFASLDSATVCAKSACGYGRNGNFFGAVL